MAVVHLAQFTRPTKLQVQNDLLAAIRARGAVAAKAGSGKPYFKFADDRLMGLSMAHVRRQQFPVSLMAVTARADFAIDAESWPTNEGSAAFLTSILAPEDEALVKTLGKIAADPAVILWATKEAALKASGDVMNDPRHLAATLSKNGHIWVRPSKTARAPLPSAQVQLYRLSFDVAQADILLALAFAEPFSVTARSVEATVQMSGIQGKLQPIVLS